MIDILLADSQTLTREGIKVLLGNIVDINVTGFAAHFNELEQLIIKHQPKVIILDPFHNHRLTVADVKTLRSKYPAARLLILSNRRDRTEIQELLDLGIKNYVFKECGREELIYAIYSAAKGEQFFCKNTFETLFGNKLIPEKDDTLPQLSSRERELIRLIAEGLTNKDIAEKLFLSVHTIKTHRKNIIKKLGFTFKNTAELSALLQKY